MCARSGRSSGPGGHVCTLCVCLNARVPRACTLLLGPGSLQGRPLCEPGGRRAVSMLLWGLGMRRAGRRPLGRRLFQCMTQGLLPPFLRLSVKFVSSPHRNVSSWWSPFTRSRHSSFLGRASPGVAALFPGLISPATPSHCWAHCTAICPF